MYSMQTNMLQVVPRLGAWVWSKVCEFNSPCLALNPNLESIYFHWQTGTYSQNDKKLVDFSGEAVEGGDECFLLSFVIY